MDTKSDRVALVMAESIRLVMFGRDAVTVWLLWAWLCLCQGTKVLHNRKKGRGEGRVSGLGSNTVQ